MVGCFLEWQAIRLGQINSIAYSRTTGILATTPISIKMGNDKGRRGRRPQEQSMCLCTLQVPENKLDSVEVSSAESMHKLENYMDCISNIRTCHSQIL